MGKRERLTGRGWGVLFASGLALATPLLLLTPVSAAHFQSPSYTIDASVGNSFGGSTNAADYTMVSSGGEAIIGNGASGSYKLGQGYVAQLDKSIELRIQPSTLAGYYAFDENFGTVAHDATLNNDHASLTNSPAWVGGKIGRGLSFNGTSQSASIPSSAQNDSETMTVSAWIKTTQVPSAATPLVSKQGGASAYPFSLQLEPSGVVGFAASDGTHTPTVQSSATVNDGAWHHIVGVRTKGSTLKLFVDGAPQGSVADNTTTVSTNSSAVGIAKEAGNANYYAGVIDEVKLFNVALTDQEVANDYAAENAGVTTAQTFGDLTGGSQSISTLALVQTDAPSYSLALQQNHDLTSDTSTIPAVSGNVAAPTAWNEGVTQGFGFTVTGGNGVPAKWGTDPAYNYAAVPATTTSFYTRSGYTGGTKDQLAIQYRLDIAKNQAAGDYGNVVTYTATMQP